MISKFKGKTYKEIYGVEKSKELRKKLSNSHKGYKQSEETKLKMSEAHKDMKHAEEAKRKMSKLAKGRKHLERTKQKISQNLKGRLIGELNSFFGKHHTKESKRKMGQRGKNHPNWKGGSSFESYGMEFNDDLKEKIRIRDGYRCQLCYSIQGKREFPVHHVDYNKHKNEEGNLITLCNKCHPKTNWHREFWMQYFQKLLEQRNPSILVSLGTLTDALITTNIKLSIQLEEAYDETISLEEVGKAKRRICQLNKKRMKLTEEIDKNFSDWISGRREYMFFPGHKNYGKHDITKK